MTEKYKWIPVTEKNPESYGKYTVTRITNLTQGKRKVGTSEYTENGWKNKRVIAWMEDAEIKPYDGKSDLDDVARKRTEKRDEIKERRRQVYELRLEGKSYKEIAEMTGSNYAKVTSDLFKYLYYGRNERDGCCNCRHCSYGEKKGFDGDLKCDLLKTTVYNSQYCERHERDPKRVLCKDCKYFTPRTIDADGWQRKDRCELKKRTIWWQEFCESGEAKDEN